MERMTVYDALAELLSYPGPDFRLSIAELRSLLHQEPVDAGAADLVSAFDTETAGLTHEEMEELYTRTFDLNPDASLETGWQLFGESYERGTYLVKMRELLRACGITESGELPDHLSYLLRAVGRLPEEDAAVISAKYLRKSVGKMVASFAGADNPYLKILQAASIVIDRSTTAKENVQP